MGGRLRRDAGRRRLLASLLAPVALLALAGCEVDARVVVTLDDDARGALSARVTLDADAVAVMERGGGRLEERVLLDGLADAGFDVGDWTRTDAGAASIRVGRPFDGGSDLTAALVDLFGPDGILADAEVTRERGFVERRDTVSVRADLGRLDAGVAADDELAQRLRAVGVDPAEVDAALDESLATAFSMTVTLVAPDGVERSFRLEPGERRQLSASAVEQRYGRLVTLLIAVVLAFLGALCYLGASISARRRRVRALATRGTSAAPPV